MLQAGRSRVRDPMGKINSLNLPNPSVALGPGVYSASNRNGYQKQTNNVSGEQSAASEYGWQSCRHLRTDCLDNVGNSTSHNLPRPVTGIALLLLLCYSWVCLDGLRKTTKALSQNSTSRIRLRRSLQNNPFLVIAMSRVLPHVITQYRHVLGVVEMPKVKLSLQRAVETLTFCRQSANRWSWGRQP
jgi:hypothetical protein